MYCPNCSQPNPADAEACVHCQQETGHFRDRVHIGRQFIFVRADEQHPVALNVDNTVEIYRAPAVLSRHRHSVAFGDEANAGKPEDAPGLIERVLGTRRRSQPNIWPLSNQPILPAPTLKQQALVTDRKIYKPNTEAALFIVAPDAAGKEVTLEVKIAGQKIYEAKVSLNDDGLALHPYGDLKEGEYTATVTLPNGSTADCSFSVAEFTLSPLIAILENHQYADKKLSFTLKMLLLSQPYSGPAEFGLQCEVCGDRVVATQTITAKDGVAQGEFDISSHGGPFHVQVTTPDGNTALVSFPGTGAREREHIKANTLGATAEMGLLPWENARPVRGFYVAPGEINMTPLMLENAVATTGKLQAASNLALAQVVIFNARTGATQVIERADVKRGEVIEFTAEAPYTFFTVATMKAGEKAEPFEGWGVVIKPVPFAATLTAPKTARPGEELDIYIEIPLPEPDAAPVPAFCWLLVYDVRLEHESPLPKLAKQIYESVRDASLNLLAGPAPSATEAQRLGPPGEGAFGGALPAGLMMQTAAMPVSPAPLARAISFAGEAPKLAKAKVDAVRRMPMMAEAAPADYDQEEDELTLTMTMAPTRMEFPELAYQELFHFAGRAGRTVRLGDQIGTWRVRAYVVKGLDTQELTADIQADKPMYAELDLPAIASEGDEIQASVNYFTKEAADLLIATPFGETRARVEGSGMQRFTIHGPGKIEVYLQNEQDSDMSARHVARPGVQTVTASRLLILDKGQTAQGERAVVYTSMGQVLKETITALIDYPFG
jgi:hypothetical protein